MLTTCTPTKHGYAMVLVMMYAQEKKKKRCQPNFFCPTLAQKSGLISSGQMNMIPIPPTPCGGWGDGLNFKNLLPQYNHHRRWKTISFPSKKVKPIQFLPEFMFSLSLSHTQPFTEVLPHAHTTIYWSPSIITQPHQELAQCCLVTKRRKTLTLTTSNMNTQCWRSCTGLSFSSTPSDSTPSLHYRTWSKNCASLVARPLPRQLTFQNH